MKALYYNIDTYQITAAGIQLKVLPLHDGAYRIIQNEILVADLYPEITAAGIYWNGFGQLTPFLADEIGNQIFLHEV